MPPPLTALKTLTVLSTAKANAAAAEMQMIQDTSLKLYNILFWAHRCIYKS